MADFRKCFNAIATVTLLAGLIVPASAQSTVQCIANAGNPTVARAEGYTELMGDLTLQCTGGTPTQAGQTVPQINIQIFLTQNVTSKITAVLGGNSSGGVTTFLESLLIIDEPNSPSHQTTPILNCGASGSNEQFAAGNQSGPGVCTIVSADSTGSSTYNGTPGHANVFQGRLGTVQNSGFPSSIVFSGVPFDPPGTGTRFVRITNVRANANGAGIAQANLTSTITMNIGIQNSTQGIQINNPQQIVAYVQRGLVTSILKTRLDFAQCTSHNGALSTGSTTAVFNGSNGFDDVVTNGTATQTPTVRFQEGFNNAWKVKNVSFTVANASFGGGTSFNYAYNGGLNYPADVNQNVPGVNYNSESGFVFSPSLTTGVTQAGCAGPSGTCNPPLGFSFNGAYTLFNPASFTSPNSGTGIGSAGIASQGTRLAIAIANVATGSSAFVPPIIYLYRQGVSYVTPTTNNGASGVMVLTSTDANGAGAFSAVTGTGNLQNVALTNGSGLAVYEILYTDPFSLEYADVPVVVAYVANLSQNLPAPGVISTAAMGFAPFYSTSAATQPSATLPHPRFQFTGTAANFYQIVRCSCNLLFPYVTQAPGYDSGIAIANTTADPYGTTNQFGTVQFWYYGTLANGGAAPATQCTNVASPGTCPGTTTVPAGQVLTYTLFNGSAQWGLDNRGAGFTGYMIAQSQFQFCHGFAFISALGAGPTSPGLSEGYIALVLDLAGLNRTGIIGEVLGH